MKTKNEYLKEQGVDLEKDLSIGTYTKIRFAMENFANDYHKSEVLKLNKANVSGRSEQLHLCPVCNEMAGKSYLLSKLPTICQKCDHAWNRA